MNDSYKMGKETEDTFVNTVYKYNWQCTRRATTFEDTQEHWDYECKDETGKVFKVEVKAHKKEWRNGPPLMNFYWVEWQNVIGNIGWLKGKADLIAFRYLNLFNLYDRNKLIEKCSSLVDFSKRVYSPKEALNCIYTRERYGRKDELSLIKISDLQDILFLSWLI